MHDYKLERGLMNILMKHGSTLPEDQQADARLKCLSWMSAMKVAFGWVYSGTVRRKQMESFEEQKDEYKNELIEIANQFLPQAESADKTLYIKSIMGFLWLLNN